MKKWLFLGLVFVAHNANALISTPIPIGKVAKFDTGVTTIAINLTTTVSANETIVLGIGANRPVTVVSINDDAGDVYTVDSVNGLAGVNSSAFIASARCRQLLLVNSSITVTLSAVSPDRFIAAYKVDFIGSVDTATVQSGAANGWSAPTTRSTNQAEELIFGVCTNNSSAATTNTPGAGWTELDDFNTTDAANFVTQYAIVTTPGTQAMAGTWAAGAVPVTRAAVVCYRAAQPNVNRDMSGSAY